MNPKINNLISPFSEAKYDLLWVIDSTISVVPGTLARAVDVFLGTSFSTASYPYPTTFESAGEVEATPLLSDNSRTPPREGDVGLVHHVPFAVVHQKSLGSLVEMAFLNSTHAKMYLAIVSQGAFTRLSIQPEGVINIPFGHLTLKVVDECLLTHF